MKRKREKPKFRIPMPPPQKPHSTKKGRKKGYARREAKRATRTTIEETEMSGLYKEGAMTEEGRRQDAEDTYKNAVRNLSPAQIALVEKWKISPEEEREISASSVLAYAREKFLEYRPYMKTQTLSYY